MAVKVTLRQKPISNGRKSLYLDFHPPVPVIGSNKTTRREFLGLHITNNEVTKEVTVNSKKTGKSYKKIEVVKNKTTGIPIKRKLSAIEKENNRNTLLLAEQIRQKHDNEINKPEIYTAFELERLKQKEKEGISFLHYYEQQMEKRSGKNYQVWVSSYAYLKDFASDGLNFGEVTEKCCNDYREYLQNANSKRSSKAKISQNTAHSYFNKFKATLKQAFKDGLLSNDLNAKITPIKQAETNRIFLSLEELNKLANTQCPNPLLKRASLFSALTGMRFSDIKKLTWREVMSESDNKYFIQFQQQKTNGMEYLPIPEQAYLLMGERKDQAQKVFDGLIYSAHQNNQLLKWAINAGIQKHLTFHCFRHTYATLQLQEGTDIYTVSKMLGHRELKTTQVYAKIVDETKRRATEKIKLDIQ